MMYLNWSGGKDSTLALYHLLQNKKKVTLLLTAICKPLQRVSMHGVALKWVQAQANSLQITLETIEFLDTSPTMEDYNQISLTKMQSLKNRGFTTAVFGDIFLEDLKIYREKQLTNASIEGFFPLWKENSLSLFQLFVQTGFKAKIICVNEQFLDKSFVGRELDCSLLADLPNGVDVCGENGEFHSFVYDGPIFKYPIPIQMGEIVYRTYPSPSIPQNKTGFWFGELQPI